MKKNLKRIFTEKIPLYYYYICKKKEEGCDNITVTQIAEDFELQTRSSVYIDFKKLINQSGRGNYGYNSVFLKNKFSELMSLTEICNFCIIGEIAQDLICENFDAYNFHLIGQINTFDASFILDNNIKMIVLTKQLNSEELQFLNDNISAIINLGVTPIEGLNIPVYNLSILNLLITYWYESQKNGK